MSLWPEEPARLVVTALWSSEQGQGHHEHDGQAGDKAKSGDQVTPSSGISSLVTSYKAIVFFGIDIIGNYFIFQIIKHLL